ncbi:ABC transporter ATP-binding protein [Pseudarthrobacter sp. S9]|uniref:ABC transporter ATP-binding protein n=1 Tax=Pseudarthrobacter sp. S9 TaxID=3418421 RepID=UPI003D0398EB
MTTADPQLIRCRRVGHTFGTGPNAVMAVRDVSFDIPPRARIALMGPSGSGKSTLLHMLAQLEMPTSGTMSGAVLEAGSGPGPGTIGLVFQGPSLIPALDVLENVALPLILAGASDTQARSAAHAALELLGLGWLERKLPEELSGGQAQRAAIARVLACRPCLILADEPTGQLDHATARSVLTVLLQTADTLGAAVLIATHDPAVAGLLDEVWHMQDGALTGSPEPDTS